MSPSHPRGVSLRTAHSSCLSLSLHSCSEKPPVYLVACRALHTTLKAISKTNAIISFLVRLALSPSNITWLIAYSQLNTSLKNKRKRGKNVERTEPPQRHSSSGSRHRRVQTPSLPDPEARSGMHEGCAQSWEKVDDC